MILLPIVLYVGIVFLGIYCLWMSYQVTVCHRLSFIRGRDRKPLLQAQLVAKNFSVMVASAGVSVLVFAAAIPAYGIKWGAWQYYLGVMAGVYGVWRQLILMRHARLIASKKRATDAQETLSTRLDAADSSDL